MWLLLTYIVYNLVGLQFALGPKHSQCLFKYCSMLVVQVFDCALCRSMVYTRADFFFEVFRLNLNDCTRMQFSFRSNNLILAVKLSSRQTPPVDRSMRESSQSGSDRGSVYFPRSYKNPSPAWIC